jgi:MFS superfamily sulfate permease-like transporter
MKISSSAFYGNFLSDIKSGFLVFLIALPLCLGISIASGFPPVAGILTAIVGGCLVSCFSGSELTIKGPAAGLIVSAIASVTELGQLSDGNVDMLLGYHRTLAVGVIAALIQIAFASFRVAGLGISMSKSVVHGMLAAIGVIIIAKQSHVALGSHPAAKDIFGLITEIPHSIMTANPVIAGIGLGSLLLLIFWSKLKWKISKVIPGQIMVLAIAIPLSIFLHLSETHSYQFVAHSYSLDDNYLVKIPASLFSAINFPDFSAIWSAASIKYIIMFALVGMIESTLTVVAIDAIDPQKRVSNLNRDLFAIACGNLVSSLIGGLPMISEIVRSKANIDAGATSARANFFHGVFLLGFVAFFPHMLSLIPLAALAAMLIYTGMRLASPSEIAHVKEVGIDQLILFSVTLLVTLKTDLLIGVTVGLLLKIILHLSRGVSLKELFAGKIDVTCNSNLARLVMHGAAAFPNLLGLKRQLAKLPENITHIVVDLSKVQLVDHTFLSGIKILMRENKNLVFEISGLEKFKTISDHQESTRWL